MATFTGTDGNDNLTGTSGADTLYGKQGNDVLRALGGNDFLYGGTDADQLYGDTGDDYLDGQWGRDSVYGGDGNDTIIAGIANDRLQGDAGNDLFVVDNTRDTGDDIIVDFGSGDLVLTKTKLADSNNDGIIPVAPVLDLYQGSSLDIKNGGTEVTSLAFAGTKQLNGVTYYSYSSGGPSPTPPPSGTTVRFAVIGDYGDGSGTPKVAQLIDNLNASYILTVGDNVYGSASYDQQVGKHYSSYIGNYKGVYGSGASSNHFFPAIGNHDYSDGGINNYLSFFTLPGNERYYTYEVGPVQFFAINSDGREPNGSSSTSVQAQWLKTELANSDSLYKIVYFHHSPYSSGANHGSITKMQWPFEQWGATAVLSGHDHTYERILRDDNGDGTKMPYFVDGLGGQSKGNFGSPISGSAVRYNADFGALFIDANDQSLTFQFVAVGSGGTGKIIDTYTINATSTARSLASSEVMTATSSPEPFLSGEVSSPAQLLGHALPGFDALF